MRFFVCVFSWLSGLTQRRFSAEASSVSGPLMNEKKGTLCVVLQPNFWGLNPRKQDGNRYYSLACHSTNN